jgi:hypothetical protein
VIPRRSALACVLALVLVACGLPEDDEPRAVDPEDIPPQLAGFEAEAAPTSSPTSADLPVYLVKTETGPDGPERRLAAFPSFFEGEPTPGRMIDQLLDTRDELLAFDQTLSNAVPPDVEISWEEPAGLDYGIITLSEAFDPEGEQYALAVAQLVYTATELRTVPAVRFRVGDEFISVPAGEGGESDDIVIRADYAHLRPVVAE